MSLCSAHGTCRKFCTLSPICPLHILCKTSTMWVRQATRPETQNEQKERWK
ncbi:hypothetical protein BACCAP_01410 [Pseudoflavonifractor capillosus ATCC 29799]|uniref:Uncharacterized protein n=1 Tax=Pseudoflavonifractor capillosus ATCC 29799 TaxID=411467 RepID=A6NT81_9FIRM|nr:hypothetical protein BACCAP_01410 [Pseudoflavonifractor capillosus ATCC 29799]